MKQDNLSCFLCCTSISESILSRENKSFQTSANLESNLDVVFLLRNLLQLPSIQLERQLKECGDHPGNWINLCAQCTQLTKNARKLYQQVKKIEKQLQTVQKQALQLIKSSSLINYTQRKEYCKNYTYFQENIRSFVKNNDYNHLNESQDLLEGDKLAKDLEIQQPSTTKILIFVEKPSPETEIKEEVVSPSPQSPPISPPADDSDSSDDHDTTAEHPPSPSSSSPREEQLSLCDHCGQQFENESFMKMHVMSVHKVSCSRQGPRTGMTCSVCGKGFKKSRHLHVHLLTKHKQDPITKKLQEETGLFYRTCSVVGCRAQFVKQIDEDLHMAKVHPDGGHNDNDVRTFKCRFCGRGFWSRHTCWRHERIHEVKGKVRHNTKWKPSEGTEGAESTESKISQDKSSAKEFSLDKRFKCSECGKSWTRAKNWSDHIWNKHEIRDITCPGLECGMVFKANLAEFQNHWKRKHWREIGEDGKRKWFVCTICGEDKGTYKKLWEHRRAVHEEMGGGEVSVVKCEICEKEFTNKYYLKSHVRHVHDKQFELTCPLCGLGQRHSGQLKKHLLGRHREDPLAKKLEEEEEGLRLRICRVRGCKLPFLKQGQLEKHVKKCHEGNGEGGKHKCKVCEKGFWAKARLINHERLHKSSVEDT